MKDGETIFEYGEFSIHHTYPRHGNIGRGGNCFQIPSEVSNIAAQEDEKRETKAQQKQERTNNSYFLSTLDFFLTTKSVI